MREGDCVEYIYDDRNIRGVPRARFGKRGLVVRKFETLTVVWDDGVGAVPVPDSCNIRIVENKPEPYEAFLR